MFHITIKPDTFDVDKKYANQNPYITDFEVNHKLALEQHKYVIKNLSRNVNYIINPTEKSNNIPDIVFIANGGLSLPRLPEPVILLPWMKYSQRKNELLYLMEIYIDLNIKMIEFPGSDSAPYEGAAESKWFNNGELLVIGYGYRCTKESVKLIKALLKDIYTSYGVTPPIILSFEIQKPDYYHLDLAALVLNQTDCVIHDDAIKPKDLLRLRKYINVQTIKSSDKFCLNSIVDGDNLLTHTLSKTTRKILQELSGKNIIECDVSEFEKAGGGVRCLVLDIFDMRHVKRKRHGQQQQQQLQQQKQGHSNPSSPKA